MGVTAPLDRAGERGRTAAALAAYAAALLLALMWLERFDLIDALRFQLLRRDARDPLLRASLYLGSYLLAVAGLAVLSCHASRWVRWSAYGASFVTIAASQALRRINGEGFTVHEARLFWSELDYLPEALAFFAGRVAVPIAATAVGLTVWAWLAARLVPRVRSWWPCALAVVALFASDRVVFYSAGKIHEFPTPYRIPLLLRHTRLHAVPYYGHREPPRFEPSRPPLANHIVFVMDESVSGDLLGINGAAWDTTPYLDSLGDRLLNYGVVSSISNLSSTTAVVIQSGLQPDQIPDEKLRSLKAPGLFSYMRRAGFHTVYIDVQTYAEPSNFLTAFDLAEVDEYIQILPLEVGVARHQRDHQTIPYIDRILRRNERSFIYLLKAGAHIHYEGRYPETERVFEPALRADELQRLDFVGADRERTFNSYLNALRWTVDDFCRVLFGAIERTGREVLVIYTSDHGQSLLEISPSSGRPEPLSHNTRVDPPVFQAMVPLFLVPFGERTPERVRALYAPSLAGRVSQFELFSTLLSSAGYDETAVGARHGPTIFDADAERGERFFVSGDHFGRADYQRNPYRPRPRPPPRAE